MKNFFAKIRAYLAELGNLTPIAFITTFLPMLGGWTLALFFAIPLGHWLRENQEIGLLTFFFGVIVFCGLALIPTNVIGIVGGWAFGFWNGITSLIFSILAAAVISFLIHKRIVGDKLPQVFDKHPKAKAIHEALLEQNFRRTTSIIFLLRISVVMPFALTNFLMASARVPLGSYVIGTFFGMLPRSAAVVFLGAGLSELNLDDPQDSWLLILGVFGTIISMIVIGTISKRALDKITNQSRTVGKSLNY